MKDITLERFDQHRVKELWERRTHGDSLHFIFGKEEAGPHWFVKLTIGEDPISKLASLSIDQWGDQGEPIVQIIEDIEWATSIQVFESIIKGIPQIHLPELSHRISTASDWWVDHKPGTTEGYADKLLMTHSELSEATEALRVGDLDLRFDGAKPEGFDVELIDAIFRLEDLLTRRGADIPALRVAKAAYNCTRPKRHGGKAL